MARELQREVLPIPDALHDGPGLRGREADPGRDIPTDPAVASPGGRRRTSSSSCWMTPGSALRAPSAARAPRRPPSASRARVSKYNCFHIDCASLADPPGAPTAATTTRSGWAASRSLATSAPGYNSIRPNTTAPLAETLKLNGYATAQFGKCHEVPVWGDEFDGPVRRAWPTGSGFEHFYGFIGGETNQYAPAIYRDTVPPSSREWPSRATTSPRT